MLSHVREKKLLIKEVAQAIPTYTISVFKLPNTQYDEMTSMVCKFWWIQTNEKTKMSWLSCDKVCTPKEEGGLGFCDLKPFNLALLVKQRWQLQTNTSSLIYRVLKARYFPNSDFFEAKLGSWPSFAWRSIIVAQNIVRKGCKLQVGDGASIGIWVDKWQNKPANFRVLSQPNTLPTHAKVSALINPLSCDRQAELVK